MVAHVLGASSALRHDQEVLVPADRVLDLGDLVAGLDDELVVGALDSPELLDAHRDHFSTAFVLAFAGALDLPNGRHDLLAKLANAFVDRTEEHLVPGGSHLSLCGGHRGPSRNPS